mmetsp:Transcript_21315/g.44389  ORF Transcript_21315/g.44389 Transcript_21315/m.44389 type:complete len:197 (+) Transcript_21315:49-639(+)|eukprot:CAMPEP_0118635864 /NCGR_PEP_ID=MMETSP0785-20121206/2303_1 /TAXON_ID=91992 /ORGANISM="Bolidomonas pacifica, Strain CCMP 1866" /LENGTH=196 /DNA_ID=CAMNT_0006526925 /DNA_START=27 /DNA_END=614 /DNA_ORIENTATION=+
MYEDKIEWSDAVANDVITKAETQGWSHHVTQPHQGHLVILHRDPPSGEVKLQKLNVWCTTGTVGSYLKHPKRKQPTQLFRREIETWKELEAIFANPRVHTEKGYAKKDSSKKGPKATADVSVTPGSKLGTIKWWSFDKGYGFVTPDDGEDDVFFHKRVLQRRPQGHRLVEGAQVEFTVVECDKGLEAGTVKVFIEE